MISLAQSFRSLVHGHPHLHVVATDGAFRRGVVLAGAGCEEAAGSDAATPRRRKKPLGERRDSVYARGPEKQTPIRLSHATRWSMTTASARLHRYAPLWRYLLFLVVIPYLVVLVTSGMQGRRAKMSPPEILASEERAGLPVSQERVNDVMSPWLAARLQDIEAHKAYVDLSLELRDERGKSTWGGEDDRLWSYYQDLGRSSTGAAHDAALWGLAYCEFKRDSSRRVVDLLASVQDQHLPYLEPLLGASLHRLGEHARADSVLRAAIGAGRFPEFATEVMATSLLESRDWKRLEELRKDPRAGPHLPNRALRALDLRRGAAWDYVVNLVRAQKMPAIPVLILLAIYACGVWFFLIRWWDAFEKEPWGTSLIAVFLGVASPVGM